MTSNDQEFMKGELGRFKAAAQDPELNILNYKGANGIPRLVERVSGQLVPRYSVWDLELEERLLAHTFELLQETYGTKRRKSGFYESTHPQRVLSVLQATQEWMTIDRALTPLLHDVPEDLNKIIREKHNRTHKDIAPEKGNATQQVRRKQDQIRMEYAHVLKELEQQYVDIVREYFGLEGQDALKENALAKQYAKQLQSVIKSVDVLNHLRRDRFVRNYVEAIPRVFSFKKALVEKDALRRAELIWEKLRDVETKVADRVALVFEKDQLAIQDHLRMLWNYGGHPFRPSEKISYTFEALPYYFSSILDKVQGKEAFSMSWMFAEVIKDLVYADFTIDMIANHFYTPSEKTGGWITDSEWYDPQLIQLKDVLVCGELEEVIDPAIDQLKHSGLISSEKITTLEKKLELAKKSGDIYRLDTWKSLQEENLDGVPIDYERRPYAGVIVYLGAHLLNKEPEVVRAYEANPEVQLATFLAVGAIFERFARDINESAQGTELKQIDKNVPWAAAFRGISKSGNYRV